MVIFFKSLFLAINYTDCIIQKKYHLVKLKTIVDNKLVFEQLPSVDDNIVTDGSSSCHSFEQEYI